MGLLNFAKKRKSEQSTTCAAILVAAGKATRMGGVDKVLAPLGTDPVLLHAARAFQKNALISEIIIVTREDLIETCTELCQKAELDKVKKIVCGGQTRTESVLAGLNAASSQMRFAAIHDAARPLVPQQVITQTVLKGMDTGAAAPALPVKDTIKTSLNGVVSGTLERDKLCAVQTPQVFDLDFIRCALYAAEKDGASLTDDCMAAERLGMKVHLTQGSEENFKITTPVDLLLAQAILKSREAQA